MKLQIVQHKNITTEQLNDICTVKQVAWIFNKERQLDWIEKNLDSSDLHCILYNETFDVIAYLNLINITLELNRTMIEGYGIGNVCSRYPKQGIGIALMDLVKKYLVTENKIGMLFCKEKLISFYEKTGWTHVPASISKIIAGSSIIQTMVINYHEEINNLIYKDKIF